MLILGLDIGGANLKAATSAGDARSVPFAVWRAPHELADTLRGLIAEFPSVDRIAVTMTAELADCFATKAAGVAAIIATVREAAGAAPVMFWQTTGKFISSSAENSHRTVAAANWHALATWAGRLVPHGKALLFDIGSTTTDIIPLHDGRPAARGTTDLERLIHQELVYTGVRRTLLCAVAANVPVGGRPCGLAAELFATMHDVYLLLGLAPEDETDRNTADGRPATIECAHDRMARMVCCDREEIGLAEACSIARFFRDAQYQQLTTAIERVLGRDDTPLETVIISGSGESVGRDILSRHPQTKSAQFMRLADSFSPSVADAACAYAVAVLLREDSR
jgi:probable H4MPT-linked C1 transfer pathway protein